MGTERGAREPDKAISVHIRAGDDLISRGRHNYDYEEWVNRWTRHAANGNDLGRRVFAFARDSRRMRIAGDVAARVLLKKGLPGDVVSLIRAFVLRNGDGVDVPDAAEWATRQIRKRLRPAQACAEAACRSYIPFVSEDWTAGLTDRLDAIARFPPIRPLPGRY